MDTHLIVLYCLFSLLLLFMIYAFYKTILVGKQVNKVARFLEGDIFSTRFHEVLTSHFTYPENVNFLIDQITPLLLTQKNKPRCVDGFLHQELFETVNNQEDQSTNKKKK